MKCYKFVGILIICVCVIVVASQGSTDSSGASAAIKTIQLPKPQLVIGASALVPGTGQLYTRHFLKGGMFLALEAITASSAIFWDRAAVDQAAQYRSILNSISEKDSAFSRAVKLEDANSKKHQALTAEFKRYNALTWMTGAYVFNLLDAFDATGLLKDDKPRNPSVAFGLSAIPVLGLGQIYNGSYSKAGLIIMTQVSLGMLALNSHRLMKNAEGNYTRINDTTITLPSIKQQYLNDWDGKRKNAMTNRNMYLWYSIFTYIYGMLDAIVDAHLHDYQEKMRIEPDLVPADNGAGLQLNIKF